MTESTDAEKLGKLKKLVESLEKKVIECKTIIDSIESATFKEPKTPLGEVLKIADEFKKERKSEALIWLTSGKNVPTKDLIKLLRENEYLIPQRIAKNNIQSAVEQILIERYTF